MQFGSLFQSADRVSGRRAVLGHHGISRQEDTTLVDEADDASKRPVAYVQQEPEPWRNMVRHIPFERKGINHAASVVSLDSISAGTTADIDLSSNNPVKRIYTQHPDSQSQLPFIAPELDWEMDVARVLQSNRASDDSHTADRDTAQAAGAEEEENQEI